MSHDSLVGRALGDFKLEALVGEGGTSVVYRATHPRHGAVALKVLRDKLRDDATAVARFLREARYGARVEHQNVVRTIEIGEAAGGMHFLAIEWATGELLEKYAKRQGPRPPDEVAEIVSQIADGVHAAHTAGVIHRDLKPDNIMYDAASRRVKLLDFGIATTTDIAPEERLTRAGFFVGTLMYVAPEALSGEVVTPGADQYSLATIAYYLLTGCLPFTGKSPREMFTQLLSEPPILLNEAREGLHFNPRVEAVIMRALSKSPDKRYPDVVTFARELRQALLVPTSVPEPAADAGLLGRVRSLFSRPR